MSNDQFKQLYALIVFLLTIAWAMFAVWMTDNALIRKEDYDIMAASGANILLGALIAWNGNIGQHYFRKSKPE